MLTDTTPSPTSSAALAGPRRRRARTALVLGSATLVGLLAALALGPVGASAEPSVSPTPSRSASPVAPPTAPTIVVADTAAATTTASGTATPGADLRVLDPQHPASSLCTATAAADGTWSCSVAVSSGADQKLTVRDLTDTTLADVDSAPFSALTPPVVSTAAGVSVGARLAGTAYPGATVTLSMADGAYSTTVDTTASSGGSWSAILPSSTVPSGTYTVTATQKSSSVPAIPRSNASSPLSVTIDREAPPVPKLLHPAIGSTVTKQPLTFDGNGQNGAIVTVYVDSNAVCSARVADGYWSCTSTGLLIPDGKRVVQAAQRDAAGNYGAPTARATVTFQTPKSAAPTAPATADPGQSPGAGQPPASPDPSATAAPSTPGSGSGGSGGSGSGGSAGGSGSGGGATGGSGGSGGGSAGSGGTTAGTDALARAEAASWTGTTGFGRTLPTLAESLGGGIWLWALVLGLVFVALVVAPLRLAATALGGRLAVRARRLTGRNRARADSAPQTFFSPAGAVAAALIAGAVLVALAAGVDDQVRYLRLAVGIVIGLAVVNGLGIALPTRLLARRFGLRLRLTGSPLLLLAAAIACLVTRVFDLDPPIVLGVLLMAGLVDGAGRDLDAAGDVRRGGIVATAQVGSLTLVSFAAWVVHGLLPAGVDAFGVEMAREVLTTACLTGLGSLIVLLIPVGRLPGRAIYSWSKPTLVGLVVVGVAAATVVYAGGPAETTPVLPLALAALGCAVLGVGAWAWVRFVEPAADELV